MPLHGNCSFDETETSFLPNSMAFLVLILHDGFSNISSLDCFFFGFRSTIEALFPISLSLSYSGSSCSSNFGHFPKSILAMYYVPSFSHTSGFQSSWSWLYLIPMTQIYSSHFHHLRIFISITLAQHSSWKLHQKDQFQGCLNFLPLWTLNCLHGDDNADKHLYHLLSLDMH